MSEIDEYRGRARCAGHTFQTAPWAGTTRKTLHNAGQRHSELVCSRYSLQRICEIVPANKRQECFKCSPWALEATLAPVKVFSHAQDASSGTVSALDD